MNKIKKCPDCGYDDLLVVAEQFENEAEEIVEVVQCMGCERLFTRIYKYNRILPLITFADKKTEETSE